MLSGIERNRNKPQSKKGSVLMGIKAVIISLLFSFASPYIIIKRVIFVVQNCTTFSPQNVV
jgi:hypothetical protein